MTPSRPTFDWTILRDEELLEFRISRLGLRIEGTPIQALIEQLYDELGQKGLLFRPPCELGDEWFVPVGLPVIFLPFFLANDRLRHLEKRMILDVEGGTNEAFMKLIRHEAAHAYSYAYRFVHRTKWRQTFGKSSTEETPTFYRPRPYSRSFVVHLDDWYAQSHPDEDFAETFAVWLTPGLDWRERYRGWKALAKLEYVDELMRSLAEQAAAPDAAVPPGLPRGTERQAQDLLREEAEGVRGVVPGLLRQRSAATLLRARRDESVDVLAQASTRCRECGLPMDKREEVPCGSTGEEADRTL